MLIEHVLEGLVFPKLPIDCFLQIFALSFKVEDPLVPRRVNNFRLNRVDFLGQECDSLALLGDFVLVLISILLLNFNNRCLLISHLLKFPLALN